MNIVPGVWASRRRSARVPDGPGAAGDTNREVLSGVSWGRACEKLRTLLQNAKNFVSRCPESALMALRDDAPIGPLETME